MPRLQDYKNLKAILIVLTVIEVFWIAFTFFNIQGAMKLERLYHLNWIIWVLHYVVAGFFIWFIWKRESSDKRKKGNNTFLILIFGIIGMWLWMPNKKELIKLELDKDNKG